MTLKVLSAGPQTTVQGGPRSGFRHLGIPGAGAADRLSLALANRLVGNPWNAAALEITFGGFSAFFVDGASIAVTGAPGAVFLDDRAMEHHATLKVDRGTTLRIDPCAVGMRIYLAVAGGLAVEEVMGSPSTYLPAAFGGFGGRALREGDMLPVRKEGTAGILRTPIELRPRITDSALLRVVPGPEFHWLSPESRRTIFAGAFRAATQIDRMGIRLEGNSVTIREEGGPMQSTAVHPGIVQCPTGGDPIILGPDAQTTGGYPRVLSVIGPDLPLLGQIRPLQPVRFILRQHAAAWADAIGVERIHRGWTREAWIYGGPPPRD